MDISGIVDTLAKLLITQVLPGLAGAIAIVLGGSLAISLTNRVVGAAARRAPGGHT